MTDLALRFEEDSHSYFIGSTRLPHVTGILEDQHLVPNYPVGPYRVRGSRVHEATQLYDLGKLDEYIVGPEVQLYVDSYDLIMKDPLWSEVFAWIPEGMGIEKRLFHPVLGYCGTIDRLGIQPMVADIKTGQTGPETGLQLAAYVLLALQDKEIRKTWESSLRPVTELSIKRYKIYLHKDGSKGEVVQYDDPLDFDVWRGLVARYKWSRKKRQ